MVRGTLAGRRGAIWLAIALVGVAISLAAPGMALAQQGQINLALLPVGQPGSYFDLTMAPGETRTFAVDIANNGAAAVVGRTYAADVYTIINGGFGARLRGQPKSGMTAWLSYPTEARALAAGQVVRRAFAIHVPSNAAPGEYIASLVLENDQPIDVIGGVDVNQFVRQAVAVVVTVPGPRAPALAIGDSSIAVVGGRSVVSVAVANTGNIRLSPEVDLALIDEAGTPVGQGIFQMGTFYAHTSTFVEVPLATLLPPGTYFARLSLSDPPEGVSTNREIPVMVVAGPAAPSPSGGRAVGPMVQMPASSSGLLASWAVLLVAGAVVGLGALMIGVIRGLRRHPGYRP